MKNKNLLKLTLLLCSSLTIMAGATIAPSLPAIAVVFKDTQQIDLLARLILTLPALTIALFAPLFGLIIERVGKKKILIWGILIYAIAGTSGYYVETIFLILVGRFFLGIAVAAIMTTVLTLIADYFYGNERASFMGIQGSFLAAGGMVYISAGGYLADLDWRAPFLIYLSALIFLPGVFLHLFEPERVVQNQVGEQIEQKVRPPRKVYLIFVIAILSMILFYMIPVQIPFLMQHVLHTNNTQTGFAIAFSTLGSALISLSYRRFKRRFSFQRIYSVSFSLMGCGFVIIAFSSDYWQVLIGLFVSGTGVGLLIPNTNFWLVEEAPEVIRGRLVGMLNSSYFVGQFFSPIIIQPLIDRYSIQTAFLVAGGVLLTNAVFFIAKSTSKYIEKDKTTQKSITAINERIPE